MTWNQLDLYSGILSEFAEHASLAHDREWDRETDRAALLAERRRFQRRYAVDPEANREAVRRCIAKKQAAGDDALKVSRRKAARAHHARAKADPVKWAALQERLRARYKGTETRHEAP